MKIMLKKRQKAVCVSVAAVIVLAILAWIIYGFTLCDISDGDALAKHLATDKDCLPEIMAVDTEGDYAAVLYIDTAYGDRAASIRYFKKSALYGNKYRYLKNYAASNTMSECISTSSAMKRNIGGKKEEQYWVVLAVNYVPPNESGNFDIYSINTKTDEREIIYSGKMTSGEISFFKLVSFTCPKGEAHNYEVDVEFSKD